MIRIILAGLLFSCSLLTVLPIPAKQLWYLAIAVGEFPWVWIFIAIILLAFNIRATEYKNVVTLVGVVAMFLFSLPIIQAFYVGNNLDERLQAAFGADSITLQTPRRLQPFSLLQMFTGMGASSVAFSKHQYAPGGEEHALRFYPSQIAGVRPCVILVHGGSWKSGSNAELPDVNGHFAKAGYQVASINYRLAGTAKSPAPMEDVHAAFAWLRAHAMELKIDARAFVLMGRSAGGQIVLNAAYSLNEDGLRGVVSFYGPTDMLFAYNDEHNKLVMDHQEVMRDFFGGSPDEVRQQYMDGSPVHYVNAQTVPTLMVHGKLDQHVHYKESEILAAKLKAAGVPHLLLGLPWATHGCEYSLNGPSGQLSVYAVERFLSAVTTK